MILSKELKKEILDLAIEIYKEVKLPNFKISDLRENEKTGFVWSMVRNVNLSKNKLVQQQFNHDVNCWYNATDEQHFNVIKKMLKLDI